MDWPAPAGFRTIGHMRQGEAALDTRESVLIAVIGEAAELAKGFFNDPQRAPATLKGPQDFVTAADVALERLIVERISGRFPGDAFLGEEGGASGNAAAAADALWIIDPIDGTANFARGIPHFCVSIGFMTGGEMALGAIAAPMSGDHYFARQGRGAVCNGRKLRVSAATDLARSVIELGWSARTPPKPYAAMLERVLGAGASFRRAGSGALGLAYVAQGRTQGYCELHINSWDVAAGLLLVTEAGGWCNDFYAGEGLHRGGPVIACPPQLREALVATTGIG